MTVQMIIPDTQRRMGERLAAQRQPKTRIQITVAIDPKKYAFAEECVATSICGSMDEVFELAITVLQQHKKARRIYFVRQTLSGKAPKDVMRALDDDIVYKIAEEDRKIRRNGKRRNRAAKKSRKNIAEKPAH